MEDLRIALALPTIPREPNSNKDSSVTNAYIDGSATGVQYAVKRPGFFVGLEGITTANVRGIYWNPNTNNSLAVITPNNQPVFYSYLSNNRFGFFWISSESYNIGDGPVYYDDGSGELSGPWYARAPNSNIPPNGLDPNNFYWSPTPIGNNRFFGTYLGLNGPTTGDAISAGYTAWLAHEPYQTCATQFPATGLFRTFVTVNDTFNIRVNQFNANPECTSILDQGIISFGTVTQI